LQAAKGQNARTQLAKDFVRQAGDLRKLRGLVQEEGQEIDLLRDLLAVNQLRYDVELEAFLMIHKGQMKWLGSVADGALLAKKSTRLCCPPPFNEDEEAEPKSLMQHEWVELKDWC